MNIANIKSKEKRDSESQQKKYSRGVEAQSPNKSYTTRHTRVRKDWNAQLKPSYVHH